MKLLCWLLLALCLPVGAQVPVTTQHNDNSRTGQNLNETILNTSNVNAEHFGELFFRTVDGQIYAQVLYVPGVTIHHAVQNVVYVATENNSVYAFNADSASASSPLWSANLGTAVPYSDLGIGCTGLSPLVGITSTPVIDTSSKTMYVVAKTKSTSNNTYHFELHALDITSGAEKFGGPVEITGQVPGTGVSSSGGLVPFQQLSQNNRAGLLLLNGVVYIAFGSMCELPPWHGWVFGYSASTLQQEAIYNTTPNGSDGGVWAGGQGLAADSENIYLMTGNGTFDANTGGGDYGDSFIKFSTAGGLSVSDYFTPYTQAALSSHDIDLGSGGPLILPGAGKIVGMGKDDRYRLVNTTNMGEYHTTLNANVQQFLGANAGLFIGGPIYWNSPNFGPVIYSWAAGDYLKAYQFTGGKFVISPVSTGSIESAGGPSNTVPLSLSANGSKAGTGIVWAAGPLGNASAQVVPGVLRAFDATNLTTELWDSQQNSLRDGVVGYAKFNPPTIANGKVYLGTFSGQLLVYGLNPPAAGGIKFVQANIAAVSGASTSATVAFGSPQNAGDLNIVVVGWKDATSTVESVVDSAGNTYSLAAPVLQIPASASGRALSQAIYYSSAIDGGSNRVTVTFHQDAAYPQIRVAEYVGVGSLDVATGATGDSASSSSGPATITSPNELIFGANFVHEPTGSAGSAFVSRMITPPNGDIMEDRAVNVVGTYSATAQLVASAPWLMQMVTFKPAVVAADSPRPAPVIAASVSPQLPASAGTPMTVSRVP